MGCLIELLYFVGEFLAELFVHLIWGSIAGRFGWKGRAISLGFFSVVAVYIYLLLM